MVAIGIYLRVLYVLQLDDDILWLVKEDKLGKFAEFEFEDKGTCFEERVSDEDAICICRF